MCKQWSLNIEAIPVCKQWLFKKKMGYYLLLAIVICKQWLLIT